MNMIVSVYIVLVELIIPGRLKTHSITLGELIWYTFVLS